MTFAIESIVRSSVVLTFGLVVLALLRHQPAAFRHSILAGAIGLAALQPAANLMLPPWTVSTRWTAPAAATPIDSRNHVETSSVFEAIVPTEISAAAVDGQTWLLVIWAAGVFMNAIALAAAAIWLAWLGRRGTDASGVWQPMVHEIAAALGIRRHVRVRVTRHPALLVTWGVMHPVILLPSDALSWQDERVRSVLAHELAHLSRRDWLVHLAAESARAIYWFNPLFWIACARLRRDSEHACDDVVLDHGIARTSYASHLVDLARAFSRHGRTWLPAPPMARPSSLERRVEAMLNTHINRRPIPRGRRLAIAAVLIAAALPVAAVTGTAGAPAGVLRDPSGRVLPGAVLRLSAIGVDAVHETQSDASGAFQFGDVPDGDYMLSARLPGFLSGRQRVRVSPSMAPLNIVLQVGTLRETVTVRSDGTNAGPVTSPSAALAMPSPPPCGTTEVGGNLKPPLKLKDVRPVYKPELAANNVDGDVLLQAVIGVDGKVRGIEVVSAADLDLEEAAIRAVSQWEFSPTYLNCQAIEVRMFVNVSFKNER